MFYPNLRKILLRIKAEGEFSQRDLAKILNCTQTCVSRYELGKQMPRVPYLIKIVKLAKKYNIKVEMSDLIEEG